MGLLAFKDAVHLVARTGLGAEWAAVKQLEGRTQQAAVAWVLHPAASALKPVPRLTPWLKLEPMRLNDMKSRNSAWSISQREGKLLQAWWVEQMLTTRTPFVERMTLFWHNHFTSSIQKTLQPSLLYQQNLLLRRHAVGNFAELLRGMARDPAMLVYLDGYQNTKEQPNENFARELLELFTIGRGHYRESDVKAAAKAFTGWGVDNDTGKFIIRADQHVAGQSTFLGKTGDFSGDDILNILLAHPRTAERLVDKIWLAFVSNRPDPAVTSVWAQQLRGSGYDIQKLLETVFNSEPFWALHNRGTVVKSPVELVIGTARMLSYPRESTEEMLNLCRLLGQELFDPPNVKGWTGGEYWISTQTLLVRNAYLAKLSRGNLDDSVASPLKLPRVPDEQLIEWLLPVKPLKPLPVTPGARRLVRALLLDPAFQVS
ncbi:MAG: hypothetical protein RL122_519 [Pseudomonadota bacterium]|jgi:uncharacterized protein (DUF1800 family)|uniref:DUF1800 domain-containing protein n=1 Tax=Thiothrix fructosivorans TaxID=111770 RepID=A0A8B0SN06_9GAMM|nr:DUF1800 domain-containing protein [Thiothrix fructosivorans]MBO0613936.1 DUF1800 domain-containing protein [Thiothrix fructosivorans]QTX10302.1 DUF1800 domain-containing protein [Thiothrix fructosivorans]